MTKLSTLEYHRDYQKDALDKLLLRSSMTIGEYDGRIAALAKKFEHDRSLLTSSGEDTAS